MEQFNYLTCGFCPLHKGEYFRSCAIPKINHEIYLKDLCHDLDKRKEWLEDELERTGELIEFRNKFYALRDQWKAETGFMSSTTDICQKNKAYQEIIGMGGGVVPYILADMAIYPDHWFEALIEITGINPVTEDIAGNIPAMTLAWLVYAKEQHRFWDKKKEE